MMFRALTRQIAERTVTRLLELTMRHDDDDDTIMK